MGSALVARGARRCSTVPRRGSPLHAGATSMKTATTALITGASAGLGEEYAKLFAADKHDVVLVARRRDRLEALARRLAEEHGVRVHVVAADLAAGDGPARVVEQVLRRVCRAGREPRAGDGPAERRRGGCAHPRLLARDAGAQARPDPERWLDGG